MTMPDERSRAVIETRKFLIELSKNKELPDKIRQDAVFLLRHYPSDFEIRTAGKIEENSQEYPIGILGPIFSSSTEKN